MITATCNAEHCIANSVPYFVLGSPERVQCGACRDWCEVTDDRDDPPMPADLPVGVCGVWPHWWLPFAYFAGLGWLAPGLKVGRGGPK